MRAIPRSSPRRANGRRRWRRSGGLQARSRLRPTFFDRIEARVDARERLVQLSRTLNANAGEWIVFGSGVRYRELRRDEELGRRTIFLDVEAGARIPAHDHPQDEECYMISGDLQIGDEALGPDDYLFARRGASHPELAQWLPPHHRPCNLIAHGMRNREPMACDCGACTLRTSSARVFCSISA